MSPQLQASERARLHYHPAPPRSVFQGMKYMPTTRRTFLRTTATIGALSLPTALLGRARLPLEPLDTGPALDVSTIVYDKRYAEAIAFAAECRSLGASVHPIEGQVHDVWQEHLYQSWRESKTPVAGLTDFRALFLLQMMARDAGMRPVLRAHHYVDGDETHHEVFGPQRLRGAATVRLVEADADWSRAIARLVVQLPAGHSSIRDGSSNVIDADARTLNHHTLVSWVIA